MSTTDQQYYTPDQSDLFLGYECQKRMSRYRRPEGSNKVESIADWEDVIIEELPTIYEELRTPYLNREQIESEGWMCWGDGNQMTESRNPEPVARYKMGDYSFLYLLITKHAIIYKGNIGTRNTIYMGEIKSINEFRRICKMVGIEKKETVNS